MGGKPKYISMETEIKHMEDTNAAPVAMQPFPPQTPQTNMMNMALAMAYVPIQMWETPYDNMMALSRGTIFPSLDKPFTGKEGAM